MSPELFYEPVLKRQIGSLDTALGLRRIGANDVDIELTKSAAKLRDAITSFGAAFDNVKNAVFVAVKRDGFTVAKNVTSSRLEVIERRFTVHELQLLDSAGRVVDVNK